MRPVLHKISVTVQGVVYNGHYEDEGGRVSLISAYGSGSAAAGRKPKAVAEKLLAEAVEKWRP